MRSILRVLCRVAPASRRATLGNEPRAQAWRPLPQGTPAPSQQEVAREIADAFAPHGAVLAMVGYGDGQVTRRDGRRGLREDLELLGDGLLDRVAAAFPAAGGHATYRVPLADGHPYATHVRVHREGDLRMSIACMRRGRETAAAPE